ncbi:ABC transporter permease [Rhizorhabdus sp. FW153]|uniref:ABC transporter permease n=1 Tax=Rhizorhabdus sp. FW153 TaxID=3400216 RepID=UPI003CEEE457
MNRVLLIARNEGRLMRRNRVAQLAILMLLLLSVVATLTSVAHRDASAALRARFQAQADRAFDGQPARHPHRMVHYGHFVFRPLPPLAAFDPGVDPFTGSTIFLEGHRQNSANFGDVRQSSLLARFGSLTPAFVLQVLAPLVLIFVGFGAVAREREQGTLRVLKAHGTTTGALVAGKVLALGTIAGLMLVPALLSLAWLVAVEAAAPAAALALGLGYAAYLLLWTVGIVAASSAVRSARSALMTLLGLWAFAIILVPRVAPDMALAAVPSPTRLETDIAIHRDLRRIGDSHDPDDPHFKAFKADVLRRYGVEKIEQLPVNYRGLLAMEGERLTSGLFDAYARAQFEGERDQGRIVSAFGLLSPTIALRSLSMALAGTDLEAHRRFLQQAEAYRYGIVQQLNRLQAEAVTYADDGSRNSDPEAGRRVRIDPRHWHDIPDFAYRGPSLRERLMAAGPGTAVLLVWTLLVGLALRVAMRRLGRAS